MTLVLLATRLKVADPTARTALATLHDRMGLRSIVADLRREELFLFEIDAPPGDAVTMVDGLARRTNLFLNPNKQTFRLTLESSPPEAGGDRSPRAWLFVFSRNEPSGLEDSVHRHLGLPAVTAIERGWLWTFTGAPGGEPQLLLDAARRAGTVHDRHAGFLVHPAFQEGRLYAERPTVYDIRDAFVAAAVSARD